MDCAFAGLEDAGLFGLFTCEGMDADPPNDPCEQAEKQLTALILNVCSGRITDTCSLNTSCNSTNVTDLITEIGALIEGGNCLLADECAEFVNSGDGVVNSGGAPAAVETHRWRPGLRAVERESSVKPSAGRQRDRRR